MKDFDRPFNNRPAANSNADPSTANVNAERPPADVNGRAKQQDEGSLILNCQSWHEESSVKGTTQEQTKTNATVQYTCGQCCVICTISGYVAVAFEGGKHVTNCHGVIIFTKYFYKQKFLCTILCLISFFFLLVGDQYQMSPQSGVPNQYQMSAQSGEGNQYQPNQMSPQPDFPKQNQASLGSFSQSSS